MATTLRWDQDSRSTGLAGFVGRAAELGVVSRLLTESRLTTLTGPAGIGKTRLALEVAERVGYRYPDGVRWVNLAGVADPALVSLAVAGGIGLSPPPGQDVAEAVVAHLGRRRLLLILDNCEHLVASCVTLITAVIGGCRDVTLLATSQIPLGAAGERTWAVPPLSVPEQGAGWRDIAGSEAAGLFATRAVDAHRGFAITEQTAPAVGEICRRLDGIPLAIELAAARVSVITPAEIAKRLEDRFAVLTGGRDVLLDRHQTLQGALDWSYDLLSTGEQALLRGMSVFAGGCTFEALQGVADGAAGCAEDVARLVSRSLVVADRATAPPRYRLLETIRAYGTARLEEAGELAARKERHARWFLELAEKAEPPLTGPDQIRWLDALEADHGNLLAALEWAVGNREANVALRLSGALVVFWRVRGRYAEGRRRLEAALALSEGEPVLLRAKALWGAGFLAHMLGDDAAARPLLEESLELARHGADLGGEARALLLLGNLSNDTEPAVALRLLEHSASVAERSGDRWCLSHALALSGWAHQALGDVQRAESALARCVGIAQAGGDEQSLCIGLYLSAQLWLSNNRDATLVEGFARRSLAAARQLGDPYAISAALALMGHVALAGRDTRTARTLFEEGLAIGRAAELTDIAAQLSGLGTVAYTEGDLHAARLRFQESLHGRDGGLQGPLGDLGLGMVALAEGALGEARRHFEHAIERARPGDGCGLLADALEGLAYVAQREDDVTRSMTLYLAALDARRGNGDQTDMAKSLEGLAVLAGQCGRAAVGARLLGTAKALRAAAACRDSVIPWSRRDRDALIDALGRKRFEALLMDGAGRSPNQAIAYARRALGTRMRKRTGWGSLTKAELAVASLAATGLTNAQIAARHSVSCHTVHNQLARVYAKLGVASRTQIANQAGRVERQAERGVGPWA